MTAAETITVLHVEDDPAFADITARFLHRFDNRLEVHSATSLCDGLTILEDTDIDCIISDYDMPGGTGFEFYDSLRDYPHDIPFILFTAYDEQALEQAPDHTEVPVIIQKRTDPAQFDDLARLIIELATAGPTSHPTRAPNHSGFTLDADTTSTANHQGVNADGGADGSDT